MNLIYFKITLKFNLKLIEICSQIAMVRWTKTMVDFMQIECLSPDNYWWWPAGEGDKLLRLSFRFFPPFVTWQWPPFAGPPSGPLGLRPKQIILNWSASAVCHVPSQSPLLAPPSRFNQTLCSVDPVGSNDPFHFKLFYWNEIKFHKSHKTHKTPSPTFKKPSPTFKKPSPTFRTPSLTKSHI